MILNDQFGYLYLTIWIHVGCPFITMRNALKNIITGGKGWSTYRGYQYLPTPSSQGGSWVAEFGTQTPIHPFGRSQVPRGCLFLLVVKRTKSQLKKSWVAKTTDALRKSEQRELLTNLQAPRIVNSWSYNPYKWPYKIYKWVSVSLGGISSYLQEPHFTPCIIDIRGTPCMHSINGSFNESIHPRHLGFSRTHSSLMKANKSPARKVSGDAFREKDVGKVKNPTVFLQSKEGYPLKDNHCKSSKHHFFRERYVSFQGVNFLVYPNAPWIQKWNIELQIGLNVWYMLANIYPG